MKIKNIISAISVTVALAMTMSCSDWLDYTPNDKTSADQQFSSRDGFYSAVNGVYNNLLQTSLYGQNLTYGAIDLMAKRYDAGNNTSLLKTMWSNHLYTNTEVQNELNKIWQAAYQNILNINVILKYADENSDVLSQQDRNLIKGDLTALRAYLHFDMLRMFGTVYSKDSTTACLPYNDKAEAMSHELLSAGDIIYKHIIPDLNAAGEWLKESDPVTTTGANATNNENGDNYRNYRQLRINYYALTLLKARVYQWTGDIDMALAEARKITDDANVKSFFPFVNSDKLLGNTVNPDRVFSTEVLFGFYYSDRNNVYINNFDGTNLSATSLLRPRLEYIEQLFSNQADFRLQSQWSRNGSYYDFVKYKKISYTEDDIPFYALLMPLMRISEAYYIAAECLVNKGDKTGAIGYLNTMLEARGITALPQASTDTEIVNELNMEYMREFWGEGQIFYMFKRKYLNMTALYNAHNTSAAAASIARYVLPLPTSEQENR